MLPPIQRTFAPLKRFTPRWIWMPLRRLGTATLAPILFTARTGHFKSSLAAAAIDPRGEPLPWYTYPAIAFLRSRDFSGATVVEFGAGQSSLWWAKRARRVFSFEDNAEWLQRIKERAPSNLSLHVVRASSASECLADVGTAMETIGSADVIVVDGLWRAELAAAAIEWLRPDGMLICDNAEGYGFQEALAASDMLRADFIGMAPGVIQEHCTAIYFTPKTAGFSSYRPIRL